MTEKKTWHFWGDGYEGWNMRSPDDVDYDLADTEDGIALAVRLDALASERDEAVRVAGELRAKAVGPIEYLRKGHSPPQVGCTACEMIAAWDTTLDALTQGGDLPLKEQE